MALTPSNAVARGTMRPPLSLRTLDGAPFDGGLLPPHRALVVAFICPHCPFVKHLRRALGAFGREIEALGAAMIGINSNDVERFPRDGPSGMREEIDAGDYDFPYLLDPTQATARAFRAACTPDFYVFDPRGALTYHGQFDASRPGNALPITGEDLRAAVRATLENVTMSGEMTPSIGCNIKWKTGYEPTA
jgi:hypothetical protein